MDKVLDLNNNEKKSRSILAFQCLSILAIVSSLTLLGKGDGGFPPIYAIYFIPIWIIGGIISVCAGHFYVLSMKNKGIPNLWNARFIYILGYLSLWPILLNLGLWLYYVVLFPSKL